jgi:hypothetical protein
MPTELVVLDTDSLVLGSDSKSKNEGIRTRP